MRSSFAGRSTAAGRAAMLAWSAGAAVLALPACGPSPSSTDVHAAGPPKAATADVAAPPAPAAHAKFEPDPPLVPAPTPMEVPVSKCRVADIDLGPAKDVVNGGGYVYPIAIAYGPKGGLAVWARDDKLAVRALDSSGAPKTPVLDGPAWPHAPIVMAMIDGFVLLRLDADKLDVQKLDTAGAPRSPVSTITLPVTTGLNFATLRASDTEITIATEPVVKPGTDNELSLLVDVDLHDATPRAVLRRIPPSEVYSDAAFVTGRYGGQRALLVGRRPRRLSVIVGTEIKDVAEEDVVFDTTPRVEMWMMTDDRSGEEGTGFGTVTHPRSPQLPSDQELSPTKARVRVDDPEWYGLPMPTWTGSHFLVARLSGKTPKTHARLFAIDCRKP
jgi:hypothetical protein